MSVLCFIPTFLFHRLVHSSLDVNLHKKGRTNLNEIDSLLIQSTLPLLPNETSFFNGCSLVKWLEQKTRDPEVMGLNPVGDVIEKISLQILCYIEIAYSYWLLKVTCEVLANQTAFSNIVYIVTLKFIASALRAECSIDITEIHFETGINIIK